MPARITLIFVPGIEGSALDLHGEELWPPTLPELLAGKYDDAKLDKLRDPQVISTGIIEYVAGLFPIYAQSVRDVKNICRSNGWRAVFFHYDWRLDIRETARRLSDVIKIEIANGRTVRLVCHSMGGLVARYVLESGGFTDVVPYVSHWAGLCVPNLGAPAAVARALGIEGSAQVLSDAQCKILLSDTRYPSGYELFPPRGISVLFDVQMNALDMYDPSVAILYNLSLQNLQTASLFHDALDLKTKPPKTVNYYLFCGNGHATDQVMFGDPLSIQIWSDKSGDGTVPLWSSDSPYILSFVTDGEHVKILTDSRVFRDKWANFIGGALPFVTEVEAEMATISVNKNSYAPDEIMSILVVRESGSEPLPSKIALTKIGATERENRKIDGSTITLSISSKSSLRLDAKAPSIPGLYRLEINDAGTDEQKERSTAYFVVQSR